LTIIVGEIASGGCCDRDIVGEMSDGSRFPGFEALARDTGEVIDALVRRRNELGLSQTVVAARMGTSQSAVARLEAGRSDPRLSTLERYAAALDTTVAYAVAARRTEEAQP
jgi:ribosome-binding protein aMBF1 (putative translation factor)